jgi:MinD-like ATPase involved in chromosome partitioning or flagellar assembly
MVAPHPEAPDPRALELSHEIDPDGQAVTGSPAEPASWPSAAAGLMTRFQRQPEPGPFPEAGAFPDLDPADDLDADVPEAAGGPQAQAPARPVPSLKSLGPRLRSMLRAQPRPPAVPESEVHDWWIPEDGNAGAEVPETGFVQFGVPEAEAPAPVPAEAEPVPAAAGLPAEEPTAAGPEATGPEVTGEVAEPEPPKAAPATQAAAEPTPPEPTAQAAPAPTAPEPAAPQPVASEPSPQAVPPVAATRPNATMPPPAAQAPPVPAAPAPEPGGISARLSGLSLGRALPSIERALSGPDSRDGLGWRRQVKVVTGARGPNKQDQEAQDRERIRQPLDGPRRIVVLGCTRGAGQTVTALMMGYILAAVRGEAVAALDLNPGTSSLSSRQAPAVSVQALLAGQQGAGQPGAGQPETATAGGARFDVVDDQAPGTETEDYQRLTELLSARYAITMVDPAPSALMRVLSSADQLVLVAPASPDAATALANTQQWLGAHGYADLAGRAVTVVNGVSKRTSQDAIQAESVARGRCRAIVRVPWDDHLSAHSGPQSSLQPQTRLAYTALAGVLVAGLTGNAGAERIPGEHSD